jgi:hypothetical protein
VNAAPGVGAQLLSAPVAVGKARFVGFSWPAPVAGAAAGVAGKVWLRARTAAGWSGWREVEPAADGPDANSSEYRRPERVYSDGQWLEAGTAEVQIRVDQPASRGTAGTAAASNAPGAAGAPRAGVEAHLIRPDMTATPGTEAPRAGVASAATTRPAIVSRAGWGRSSRCAGPRPATARR